MQSVYYNNLGANKRIYDAALQCFQNRGRSFPVTGSIPAAELAIEVLNDHPEIFYVGQEFRVMSSLMRRDIMPVYLYSPAESVKIRNQLDATAQTIISEHINDHQSDYDKVRSLHDYLKSNLEYDTVAATSHRPNERNIAEAHNIIGALLKNKCVCEGFAKAFKFLCDKIGLECWVVSGKGSSSIGAGPHAWNIVRINGYYHHVAAESENRNPSENGTEQQNEPAETESTQTVDTENEAPRNDTEVQNDSADNKTDSSTDTRDQNEEQPDDTNSRMENKAETPEGEDAYRTAMNNMAEYMSEHNYGPDDYAEYSQDPEWQKLNADLQQSLGMEVTTDASTPSPESGKDVSATELPDNCVMVNASDIDMTYAQGMDSDQFWNHHGNTKEDYMRIAEGIPDVQQALDSGKSLDEIKQDPDLKDTAHAYFDPENMIKVEQQADGSYSFADDGRHRIAAAQELGYEIPVQVTNLPENANASAADVKPEGTATAEDVANKSDISSETRENLGAFEQKGDKTGRDNAVQSLCGLCVVIFKDVASKKKYDNYVNLTKYRAVNEAVDELALSNQKRIEPKMKESLIDIAVRQYHVSVSDASVYINHYCEYMGYALPENKIVCGLCGTENPAGTTNCVKCGKPLIIPCPACSAENNNSAKVCAKCGFDLTKMDKAVELLHQAKQKYSEKALEEAERLVKEAKAYWPNHADVLSLEKTIQDERKQAADTIAAIMKDIQDKKMYAAQTKIDQAKANGFSIDPSVASKVTAVLKEVESQLDIMRNASGDEAFTIAMKLTELIADSDELNQSLKKFPPDEVPAVSSKRVGDEITLTWKPSPSIGEITYVVVRKENTYPNGPTDGSTVYNGKELAYTDSNAPKNTVLYYSVFAVRIGVHSKATRLDEAVAIVGKVTNLKAIGGDEMVTLSWTKAPTVTEIRLYKYCGYERPQDDSQYETIPCTRLDGLLVSGLTNGTNYWFAISAGHTLNGKT